MFTCRGPIFLPLLAQFANILVSLSLVSLFFSTEWNFLLINNDRSTCRFLQGTTNRQGSRWGSNCYYPRQSYLIFYNSCIFSDPFFAGTSHLPPPPPFCKYLFQCFHFFFKQSQKKGKKKKQQLQISLFPKSFTK